MSCFCCTVLLAQTNPIKVDLALEREYTVKFHKSYFQRNFESHPDFTPDSLEVQYFKVHLGLRNNSADTIMVWIMTFSWFENFASNNRFIGFEGWPCDKNHPTGVVIAPKEKKDYTGMLAKNVSSDFNCNQCLYKEQAIEFKIGLINDCTKPSGFCPDSNNQTAKRTITWSNSVSTKITLMRWISNENSSPPP